MLSFDEISVTPIVYSTTDTTEHLTTRPANLGVPVFYMQQILETYVDIYIASALQAGCARKTFTLKDYMYSRLRVFLLSLSSIPKKTAAHQKERDDNGLTFR